MYGAPIILTEPYDPLTDSRKLARATYEETVNFIVSEASQAAALLDANISESDAGRASKGAAYMLKAKTYFWASGVKFQNRTESYLGFPDDRTDRMYTLAAESYDSLMSLNRYELVQISETTQDGIANAYHDIFLTKTARNRYGRYNTATTATSIPNSGISSTGKPLLPRATALLPPMFPHRTTSTNTEP